MSAYIDGTLTYGGNKAWADQIRLFRGGRLKVSRSTRLLHGGHLKVCCSTRPLHGCRLKVSCSTDCYQSRMCSYLIDACLFCALQGLRDSYPSAFNFPAYNDVELPLANPPPPRDHPELKPVKRFYSKSFVHSLPYTRVLIH